MTITISLKPEHFNNLDVSPVQTVIEKLIREGAIAASEQQITFEIEYPREPEDPRELPEIPEIRLWFVRLDAAYPWLPFLLDW
ncbi:MAG TPA: chlororespiratory reduction 6 domain-containing protein, partial [Blastocatellia bacterium]|nr:chlororespiratory reduction 6 domain-containing protein [Blastocatellia bacterium]